jgi:threonine synthase
VTGGPDVRRSSRSWRGIVHAYRPLLPVSEQTPIVTLHEGGTPLLIADSISNRVGAAVYLKIEGVNPTGSFKDRGMTMAISKALEAGAETVLCASTGNTSASAAAYAARAGLACAVMIPRGDVSPGKVSQARAFGARIIEVDGNFDACMAMALEIARRTPAHLVNSVNPVRLEGQKTAAFEICDTLGDAPGIHCLPVGNAGNITAHWQGYRQYLALGRTSELPRMWGFQASGSDPIVQGRPLANPKTVAAGIRIGNPASWDGADRASRESGGLIAAVTDAEILAAQRLLAREEGVFVEAASAAAVAGLLNFAVTEDVPADASVVCTLTGNGLKEKPPSDRNTPDVVVRDITDAIHALG